MKLIIPINGASHVRLDVNWKQGGVRIELIDPDPEDLAGDPSMYILDVNVAENMYNIVVYACQEHEVQILPD